MTLEIYLGCVLVMSLASFFAYGLDKQRAIGQQRRIPEQTLHTMDLLGGWPGGLLGQKVFRHKTRKLSFQIVFWATVVIHLIGSFLLARQFAVPSA